MVRTLLSPAAVAALAIAAQSSVAATVVISPSKDNTLYESVAGNTSNGSGSHVFAGSTGGSAARRALIAFDLAGQVPDGATVDAVELRLHVSRTLSGPQEIAVHRVSADWGEGASDAAAEEGGGAPAAAGDATWLQRFHPATAWTTPGGDYVAAASATATAGGEGSFTVWSGPGLVADVTAWLSDPSTNFGWILIGNETAATTAKRFDSREIANADFRPQLTIEYTPIPLPAALALLLTALPLLAAWGRRGR